LESRRSDNLAKIHRAARLFGGTRRSVVPGSAAAIAVYDYDYHDDYHPAQLRREVGRRSVLRTNPQGGPFSDSDEKERGHDTPARSGGG
jgi:hypothetical protein